MAPHFPNIIFPGNVGNEESLREVYQKVEESLREVYLKLK